MDQDRLHALKKQELESVITAFGNCFEGKDLLEIGAGTGYQLSLLTEKCKSAIGIDLPTSAYSGERVTEVTDYDGIHIPFPDRTFDVIFTSSVLEHIVDVPAFHREMHRVLKTDGIAVHIVPTHVWRLWTALAHYPALPKTILNALRNAPARAVDSQSGSGRGLWSKLGAVLFPPRHGERGNALTEVITFRPRRWVRQFEEQGWNVERAVPTGLFQTGYCLFGLGLPVSARLHMAKVLGSACRTYLLTPRPGGGQ